MTKVIICRSCGENIDRAACGTEWTTVTRNIEDETGKLKRYRYYVCDHCWNYIVMSFNMLGDQRRIE